MKLIVGLGNPGSKYAHTRHNVGFMVVDALAKEAGIPWTKLSSDSLTAKGVIAEQEIILLKPQAFMNESGKSIGEVSRYYKISPADVWVIHDDVDLPFGRIKLDENSSAAGHHGVESAIDILGTKNFKRFRVGIGRPPEQIPVDVFVLEQFTKPEAVSLGGYIEGITLPIKQALKQGFSKAQELTNQRKVLAP